MEVGRRVLDAAQREGLDRPIGARFAPVDHALGEKAFGPQIVHREVGVVGRSVAGGALRFAKKQFLPAQLALAGFPRIELAINPEFGCGWEVEQRLELCHRVDLTSTLQRINSLLRGDDGIAVEVCRALLELGEVLDRLERALRAEEPLDIHSAQRGRINAMPVLLRADVADKMRSRVGVAVRVAVKARDAAMRMHGAAVARHVELLLGKRGE